MKLEKPCATNDLGDAQAVGGEWAGFGAVRVGVFDIFSHNSRINQGNDATEGGRGWESRVRADRRDANNERVEVLLGGNETSSCSNSGVTTSELGDNRIGLRKFCGL